MFYNLYTSSLRVNEQVQSKVKGFSFEIENSTNTATGFLSYVKFAIHLIEIEFLKQTHPPRFNIQVHLNVTSIELRENASIVANEVRSKLCKL